MHGVRDLRLVQYTQHNFAVHMTGPGACFAGSQKSAQGDSCLGLTYMLKPRNTPTNSTMVGQR